MKKKVLAAVLAACMVLGMVGCGSTGENTTTAAGYKETESEEKVTACLVGPVGGLIWEQLQKGWEDACAELSWDSQYVGPGVSAWSNTEAVSLYENAVTQGAQVAVLISDLDVALDATKEAKQKGVITSILQFEYDEETMSESVDYTIMIDPVKMAELQCKALEELVGDNEAHLVYIRSHFSNPSQSQCWEYIQEYFKDSSNITVEAQYETNGDSVKAQNLIADLRKVDPINAVIMCDGGGTIGVATYIEENDLADEIYMIGSDYEQQTLQATKDGIIDRLAIQDWYNCGYLAAKVAAQVKNGEEHEMSSDAGSAILDSEGAVKFAADLGIELE